MKRIDEFVDEKYIGTLNGCRAVGIDIGSRAAKGVLLYDGGIVTKMISSGVSSEQTWHELLTMLAEEANVSEQDIRFSVGTGYGRVAMNFGEIPFEGLTEISCHALGAHCLNAGTRTIVDIGGQDSKAISVDPDSGRVVEFVMNDKCAAGTGRFLEKVAMILELPISELGEYALRSQEDIEISSQCVVFAESEVVSFRAQGKSREDIAAGIHRALARRVKNLLNRTSLEPTVIFTGGVSNNMGMRRALEDVMGFILGETKLAPTFAGALGAAVTAARKSAE